MEIRYTSGSLLMRRLAGSVRARALHMAFVVMLVSLVGVTARAELRLDGRWKQTPLREDFTVQQWLDTRCGPPPSSTITGGGEVIDVRMEGDDLAFVGAGRVFRTNQCYDPMPTLTRETHSRDASGKTWRTRCTTAPADPRKAILNSLVVVTTETHIDLVETGRYEITVENGRCMADVKRTRSFDLVRNDAEPAPSTPINAEKTPTAKVSEPPKPAVCEAPGAPQKLEVRPSKKLLRPGESFKFRPLVLDARGCATHTPTTWKLALGAEGHGIKVDPIGNVTIANDAPEGTVEIIVSAAGTGGKNARVLVEVASAARYDELLARSGLNAAGENDEASTVTIATQSIGAGEGRVEDRARERRVVFLAIIGFFFVVLGALAVTLRRRTARANALLSHAEARHAARVQEVLDRRRQREAEHDAQMKAHEESVAVARAFANEPRVAHEASVRGVTPSRGKICPTCGGRFEGAADFCGKDGTQLVPLN